MDSFSLYCLATESDQAEMPRALGLIEARLAADDSRADNWLYKGALLARMGAGLEDQDRRQRFLTTGLNLMRGAQPSLWLGAVVQLQMLYARALTVAILPRPPVTLSEASRNMQALLGHPGFDRLHPLRRAQALAMKGRLPGGLL
ncbi:MAG: hypothetical protein Q4G22_04880 [Paracoccus sp. (in: a-proteobacteria)]|uniref:hypothetical protein n=1 Tax=Paracoccus sp. TaxID=267 RepID=UPI0026E0697F|nr:hypothetical protein [Paracoccus sp. (in: a-proteobacteria)]MDO5631154.1 hypothetical protein [Paracoccus sp. (in: a-proteobacteria)]